MLNRLLFEFSSDSALDSLDLIFLTLFITSQNIDVFDQRKSKEKITRKSITYNYMLIITYNYMLYKGVVVSKINNHYSIIYLGLTN